MYEHGKKMLTKMARKRAALQAHVFGHLFQIRGKIEARKIFFPCIHGSYVEC